MEILKRILRSISCVLLFAGVLMLVMEIINVSDSKKTVYDYYELEAEDIEKGMIIEGDLEFTYGPYMESYTTNYGVKSSSSDYYYIIPIGYYEFMGFKVNSSSAKGDELDTLWDESYDYLTNDDEYPNTTPVYFKGKVKSMPSEDQGYFREVLEEYGYSNSEINEYFIPYYIDLVADEAGSVGRWVLSIVMLVLGAGMLVGSFLIKRREV